jgi:hypothetical protein
MKKPEGNWALVLTPRAGKQLADAEMMGCGLLFSRKELPEEALGFALSIF